MEQNLHKADSLRQQGFYDEAYKIYQDVLKHHPQNLKAFYGLALCRQAHKRYPETIELYRRMLTIDSSLSGVWNDLGLVYMECYRLKEALMAFEKSLALTPSLEAYCNLARLAFVEGKIKLALELQRQGLTLLKDPYINSHHSNYLFMLRSDPTVDDSKRFEYFRSWGKLYEGVSSPLKKKLSSPLNIGYLSPDFSKHSVSLIFKPLYEHHNRERFNIFTYSDSVVEDERTTFFKEHSDYWCQCAHLSDTQLAQQIQADGIDILVDLAGHTAGNRLRLFSQRLAPVQVTGLGLCCTTGLSTIDYLLTDPHVLPPELARYNSEKIIYLPSFLYWEPPSETLELKDPPALKNGYITFGCGNEVFKLNEEVIELWADILKLISNSKLFLKARAFKSKKVQKRYLGLFEQFGVAASRIQFQGPTTRLEHLDFYNQIDIALDPFPYQGGSSTCETLWMGVPVIVLQGGTRTSDSLVRQVGEGQWLVSTKTQYLKLSKELSENREALKHYKANLRHQVNSASFRQGKLFCRSFENAMQIV